MTYFISYSYFCFYHFQAFLLYNSFYFYFLQYFACYLISMCPTRNFRRLYTFTVCASSISSLLVFSATIITVRFVGFFNICLFFVGVKTITLLFLFRSIFLVSNDMKNSSSVESCDVNLAYRENEELLITKKNYEKTKLNSSILFV